MKNTLRKTLVGLILVTVLLSLAGFVVFKFFFTAYYFGFFPFLLVFFLLVHALFFVTFFRALKKSSNQFIRSFMASTAIKLVLYFFVILGYFLISPTTSIPFAITLSITYLAFTAYDLMVMLSAIRTKKENNPTTDQLSN